MAGVKFNPLGREHEVDMVVVLVAPELEDLPEVELADDLMGGDQGVHVSFETKLCVY